MSRRRFFQVLVTTVVAVCILAFSGILSAQGNNGIGLERAREVQERHTEELMARPGVVGTAIGLNGNGGHAVLVLLERPGVTGIPNELDGVPVHVRVTGRINALPKPPSSPGKGKPPKDEPPSEPVFDTSKWPWHIGVSTGHPDITAGTIGCRVKDGRGNLYVLSNNHVYANENSASLGDYVLAPGPYDGGQNPADAIGTLYAFTPIKFGPRGQNVMDAAIARIMAIDGKQSVGNATPEDGYGVPGKTAAPPEIEQGVQKYGRTTGLTEGSISGVNVVVRVFYGGGFAYFVDQILIEPGEFSSGGDSGSLIVTNDHDRNPVGLLFAGSSAVTIANPIGPILTEFGVEIDGE